MSNPAPAARRRSKRFASRLGALLVLFHALCVLASWQLSGAGHVIEEVASSCDLLESSDECPDEKPGRECPPGCPSCHCSHPAASTPSAATMSAIAPSTEVSEALAAVKHELPPASAQTRGVWRPPRAS